MDGYRLIYHDLTNQSGVAIVASDELRDIVAVVHRHSDRLLSVFGHIGTCRLQIFSSYAIQVGCDTSERYGFWEELYHETTFYAVEHLL